MQIGEQIPNLDVEALVKDEVKKMHLHEHLGKWLVFIFYPGDFTFICPTELEDAQKLYADFKKEGAEIFSVSTDTVWVHKAWHDTSPAIKDIEYAMIADPTGKVCKAFGTYIEVGADEGQSLRGTFVVSPEGKLVTIEIHHNDVGRNMKETLRRVRAAKFVLEHPGKVCPASWEPGDDTLSPGLDLVGKI